MKLLTSLLVGVGIFVAIMAVLAKVPFVLGRVLYPLNMRRIKTRCEAAGFTDIKIKAWPNHYGVSYQKEGKQHHAKCRVVGRNIKWQGKTPEGL
jgi:hypothetical protein